MRSPGQIPQLVARRFDDERTLEEQLALVYSSLGSNQLFVNPERSTHNCSECSIAVDQRLAGLGAAVARGERLDAYADDDAGVAAELADPEVLAKLIDADETNPDLIALRDGRVTFEALIDAGRPPAQTHRSPRRSSSTDRAARSTRPTTSCAAGRTSCSSRSCSPPGCGRGMQAPTASSSTS